MKPDAKTTKLAEGYRSKYRNHASAACQEQRYRYMGVECDTNIDCGSIDYEFLEAIERAAGCRIDQVGEYRWACCNGYESNPAGGCKSLYVASVSFAREVVAEARKRGLVD